MDVNLPEKQGKIIFLKNSRNILMTEYWRVDFIWKKKKILFIDALISCISVLPERLS